MRKEPHLGASYGNPSLKTKGVLTNPRQDMSKIVLDKRICSSMIQN
jgi:hypothetical protein